MHARTLGSRQFDQYLAVGQANGVITGAHILAIVRETLRVGLGIECWQEGNVAQIANAGTTQMGVTKANDERVTVMIARAPVPPAGDLRGA